MNDDIYICQTYNHDRTVVMLSSNNHIIADSTRCLLMDVEDLIQTYQRQGKSVSLVLLPTIPN